MTSVALILCCFVAVNMHDAQTELPVVALTLVTSACCFASRLSQAWWDVEHDRMHRLAWSKIGAVFWSIQICFAMLDPLPIALRAHSRVTTSQLPIGWAFLLAGFLSGVEPGTGREKLTMATTLSALTIIRLAILCQALQANGDDSMAQELMREGLGCQLASPLLGSVIGLITRSKIEVQARLKAEKERLAYDFYLSQQEVSRLLATTPASVSGASRSSPARSHTPDEAEQPTTDAHVNQSAAAAHRLGLSSVQDDDRTTCYSELAAFEANVPFKSLLPEDSAALQRTPTGHGSTSSARLPASLRGAAVFTLLPGYEDERLRSGSAVEYLGSSALRAPYMLRVEHGRLVDAHGLPLNASEGDVRLGKSAALYVLEPAGEVLITLDGRHRHSSLVAGGAVLAAGELRICDGILTHLDNCSGHYQPAASSLDVVLERFRELGANVDRTRIVRHDFDAAEDSDSGDAVARSRGGATPLTCFVSAHTGKPPSPSKASSGLGRRHSHSPSSSQDQGSLSSHHTPSPVFLRPIPA